MRGHFHKGAVRSLCTAFLRFDDRPSLALLASPFFTWDQTKRCSDISYMPIPEPVNILVACWTALILYPHGRVVSSNSSLELGTLQLVRKYVHMSAQVLTAGVPDLTTVCVCQNVLVLLTEEQRIGWR